MNCQKFVNDLWLDVKNRFSPSGLFGIPQLIVWSFLTVFAISGGTAVIVPTVSRYFAQRELKAIRQKLTEVEKLLPVAPVRSKECEPNVESGRVYFYTDRRPLAVEECSIEGKLIRINYYDDNKIAEDDIVRNGDNVSYIERKYFSGEIILVKDRFDIGSHFIIESIDCSESPCGSQPRKASIQVPPMPPFFKLPY